MIGVFRPTFMGIGVLKFGCLRWAKPRAISRVLVGVWLSPVEHCVRDAGVAGSNPATPTKISSGISSDFGPRSSRPAATETYRPFADCLGHPRAGGQQDVGHRRPAGTSRIVPRRLWTSVTEQDGGLRAATLSAVVMPETLSDIGAYPALLVGPVLRPLTARVPNAFHQTVAVPASRG